MRILNKDDLLDLQYLCEVLRYHALQSLQDNEPRDKYILELTKTIAEVVTNGPLHDNDYVESLKKEIKTQRKEIAGLREERRMILNQDAPPNRGCDGI